MENWKEPRRLGDILNELGNQELSNLPGIRLYQQLIRRIRMREQGIDPDQDKNPDTHRALLTNQEYQL